MYLPDTMKANGGCLFTLVDCGILLAGRNRSAFSMPLSDQNWPAFRWLWYLLWSNAFCRIDPKWLFCIHCTGKCPIQRKNPPHSGGFDGGA
jgi:hypothetical protein